MFYFIIRKLTEDDGDALFDVEVNIYPSCFCASCPGRQAKRCTVCAVVVNIIFDDIQHKPSRQGRHHHNNVKLH